MPRFNVVLDFSIVHALCDPTDPNGTPEQIAAQGENLTVELVHQHQGIRSYRAALTVEAAREDDLTDHLIGLFSHLPKYQTGRVGVREAETKPEPGPAAQQDQAPTGSGPDARDETETGPPSLAERQAAHAARMKDDSVEKPFRVQCYFKSDVPFEVLEAGFVKHVAVGNLVSNSMMGAEFVAFVKLNALSADGLEDIVETLLRRAFDAETEESAVNFRPVKTQLI